MSSTIISAPPVARPSIRPRPTLARLLRYSSAATLREGLWGTFFAMPWLLGLVIFVLGPIIVSMYLSLTRYDAIRPPVWLGISNYVRAFTEDELFWPSLGRTFRYALVVVPFGMIGSLALALLLNQGLAGTTLFRTFFFLPNLTPAVAMAILWRWLLHPAVGPINYALGLVGIEGPGWLTDPRWALSSLIGINLWAQMGGNQMLIFLAGLQGVPQEFYDAAKVDGAGSWYRFWHVTLPMVSPTLFFNLIMGIIGSLQVFSLAFVATEGGPSWATWFYVLHLFRWSFERFEMGYGAALAWIFAFILIMLTLIQFKLSKHWVYYAGGAE